MNDMINSARKKIIMSLGKTLFPKLPGSVFNLRKPKRIIIEPVNICNLRCPLCPTTTMKRKRGVMKLKEFKEICDSLPSSIKDMELFLAGEPLINPELPEMIKYASEKGINCSVSTNSMLLDKKYTERLLDSGLFRLIVALDGSSKKTHEAYRIGSDFDVTVNNIKHFCKEKKRKRKKKPEVMLQFIVMKKNEHEIKDIIKLGKDIGVDMVSLKTISLGSVKDIKEKEKIKDLYLPKDAKYSRYTELGGLKMKKASYCYWIWSSVILWNGDVTTCCYDFNGDLVFSNVFKDGGFSKIWNSKKYGKIREQMLNSKYKLCENCNLCDSYYTKSIKFK